MRERLAHGRVVLGREQFLLGCGGVIVRDDLGVLRERSVMCSARGARDSGFGVQPPGGVQPLGVRQHVALPLTGEFPADVGVHEHDLLLMLWTWGLAVGTILHAVWPGTGTAEGADPRAWQPGSRRA